MTEIPRIISVDDHVVEPPHLFERWLPKPFPDDPRSPHRAPWHRVDGAHGGTSYDIVWDDTRRRPTRGSTKISCSRTSATWPRSGSSATT